MRTRTGENELGTGGDGTAREDRLYPERGGSGHVSRYAASAQEQAPEAASSGSDRRGDSFRATPWFAPVEDDIPEGMLECKDGVCPVPWAVKEVIASPVEDVVNHPTHYTNGSIECIEAIEAQLTAEEYRGYLKGNIAKYLWRERHKGNLESLKKAQWYLDRLTDFLESNQEAV